MFVLFLSCKDKISDDYDKLQSIRKNKLATEKEVNKVFLGFEFGDSLKECKRKLDSLDNSGKVNISLKEDNEIKDVKYEFKQIEKLNGIDFFLNISRHNDSLMGIALTSISKMMWRKNYNSHEVLFKVLLDEYKKKYGEPDFRPNPYSVFWIKGNLEIHIELTKSKDSSRFNLDGLSIRYVNIKKEQELIKRNFRGVKFLDNGDTVDDWYQKETKKKIVSDI